MIYLDIINYYVGTVAAPELRAIGVRPVTNSPVNTKFAL
jgi:hypothetical protein